jgi:hypothetical protein
LNNIKFHFCHTLPCYSQHLGRGRRDIDGSSPNIGAAIVHANCHRLPSFHICHTDSRAEWQRAVSGRQIARIEFFAARRSPPTCIEASKCVSPARRHRGAHCGFVSDNRGLSTGSKPCRNQGNGSQPTCEQGIVGRTSETVRGRHDTQSPPRLKLNKQLGLDRGQFRTTGFV